MNRLNPSEVILELIRAREEAVKLRIQAAEQKGDDKVTVLEQGALRELDRLRQSIERMRE